MSERILNTNGAAIHVTDSGVAVVTSTDFGIVAESGKLQAIVGFFEHVATGQPGA
jgi:hypothetical protein